MDKEFVPYEQALALKELGFDEPCFGYRDGGGYLMIKEIPHCVISAPTFSQAFRWFRKTYKYSCYVVELESGEYDYVTAIRDMGKLDYEDGPFQTYEEAELACLIKLIEIVK